MSKTNNKKSISNNDDDIHSSLDLDELLKEIDNEESDNNDENNDYKKEKQEQYNKRLENESKNQKRTCTKLDKETTKKQKTTNHDNMIKKGDHIEKEENNNNKINNNNEENFPIKKVLKEYIHLFLMKQMDQYVEEFKKENNGQIPFYLDIEASSSILDKIETLEEVFQKYNNDNKDSEKNKVVRFTLIAQYQLYLWLKNNHLLQNKDTNISEENKNRFRKWVNSTL